MKYHIEFDLKLKENPYKGLYIVLEGTESAGKTTQALKLAGYFKSLGREVVMTREPRKEGLIGDMVHNVLIGKLKLNPVAFQYLFSADRMLNHAEIIEPALKSGKVVVSDRNFWSAVVYGILDKAKGYSKENMDQLLVAQSILSFYHQFIAPDLTFYLKIPLDISLKRLSKKKDSKEIYENKDQIEKIIKGYNFIFNSFKNSAITIDGSRNVDEVTREIVKEIEKAKR